MDLIKHLVKRSVYFHASTENITTLPRGEWVTTSFGDAAVLGAGYDPDDLKIKPDPDGRPPHHLEFKRGAEPPEKPIYIYAVEGYVQTHAVDDNIFPWIHATLLDYNVLPIAQYPSWRAVNRDLQPPDILFDDAD